MNPIEQRLRDAGPVLETTDPAFSPMELQFVLIDDRGPEQLTSGNAAAYRAARVRRGARWRGRHGNWAVRLVLFAATVLTGILLFVPQRGQDDSGAATGIDASQPEVPWRKVAVTRPWAMGPQLTAEFDVPKDWQVQRQRVSGDFPGLHAIVRDGGGLAVAMLYLGPVPAGALAGTCTAGPAGSLEMDREELVTGAEVLGSPLRAGYSYSLLSGPETRGTFGLVPVRADGSPCAVAQTIAAEGQLVLQFGDALRVPVAGGPPVPRSGYARTFAAGDDARGYLASAEYAVVRRMITSLRVEVPADASALWNVAGDGRPGWGRD